MHFDINARLQPIPDDDRNRSINGDIVATIAKFSTFICYYQTFFKCNLDIFLTLIIILS